MKNRNAIVTLLNELTEEIDEIKREAASEFSFMAKPSAHDAHGYVRAIEVLLDSPAEGELKEALDLTKTVLRQIIAHEDRRERVCGCAAGASAKMLEEAEGLATWLAGEDNPIFKLRAALTATEAK